jgi:hypothetical protein
MQQHHYSPADLTGDSNFPTHLTKRQAVRLIASHDHTAAAGDDGTISASCYATDRNGQRCDEMKEFKPNELGMYRAAPILLWLGY